MWGEKFSFFSDSGFVGIIDEILVLKRGSVYHVVIRISYLGSNQRDVDQGGLCYERDGTLDINKGYLIAFKLLY